MPNEHFKHALEIMVLPSSIIMWIIAGSLINNSWQQLNKTNKRSVYVLHMLIFKMARKKRELEICRIEQEGFYYTL